MSRSKIKELKLVVRIQRDTEGFYFAQVYKPIDDKELLNYLDCDLAIGWNTIVKRCLTKWGCKHAVKTWKEKHFIEILEM